MKYCKIIFSLSMVIFLNTRCKSLLERNIEKDNYEQYLLLIRDTKIYSQPYQISKYEIGTCPGGNIFKSEITYYNRDKSLEALNLTGHYYKVYCNKIEGFLPDMREYVNIVTDERKENFPKNWTILRDLSIFDETFNDTYRNKEEKIIIKLSGNLYGGFTNKKIARARFTVYRFVDNKDTSIEELGQITKIAPNFVVIQFKNTEITITKIKQDKITVTDKSGFFLGENNKNLSLQSSNIKLGYEG